MLSSELMLVVTRVLAFNVPDMFTPSLICIAVLSDDAISFTFSVPVTEGLAIVGADARTKLPVPVPVYSDCVK